MERFAGLLLVVLFISVFTGIVASGKELLLTVLMLHSLSGRAALILAGIFFAIGWACAYLRGTYVARGCELDDENRPSVLWTFGSVFVWFGLVFYVFGDWNPGVHKTFDSDGMAEIVAQSISVPIIIGFFVHGIATTYKHSRAMSKKEFADWLKNTEKKE